MTQNKEKALDCIKELREYCKDYFHISWDMDLERLGNLIKDYPEPKNKGEGIVPS